jgi:hypothetical protein
MSGKFGHFLRHIIVGRLAKTHLNGSFGGLHQTKGRARSGQADGHLRTDGFEGDPIRQFVHDKAHTFMSTVKAYG